MREIRTSGATRGEVALRVLPYSTVELLSLRPIKKARGATPPWPKVTKDQ